MQSTSLGLEDPAQVRNFKLEQEQEKNKILSEALEALATEHHELERSLVEGSLPVSVLSEEEFYDALSGNVMAAWWGGCAAVPECTAVQRLPPAQVCTGVCM